MEITKVMERVCGKEDCYVAVYDYFVVDSAAGGTGSYYRAGNEKRSI